MLQRVKELLRTLRDIPNAVTRSEELIRHAAGALTRSEYLLRQLARTELLNSTINSPRFKDPLRLLSSGFKVYSQGYEDGMIAEVFRRIGVTSKRFIEFGVQDGMECNTTFLLIQGWSGAWMEGSSKDVDKARRAFRDYPVEVLNELVKVENADYLMVNLARGVEVDLLSIDIDFNDYWVWKSITTIRPRLVVIEYNAIIPPDVSKTVPYDPSYVWDGSNYYGASLGALEALGRTKGYALVGCSLSGVNAFFVRDDLVEGKFHAPFTSVNHYEPERYDLALGMTSGHRPGIGPWVSV